MSIHQFVIVTVLQSFNTFVIGTTESTMDLAAESVMAFSKQFILSCSDRLVSLSNLAEKRDQRSLHSKKSLANVGRFSLRLLYPGDRGVAGPGERE